MGKIPDPGLAYLNEIGFRETLDKNLEKRLRKTFGYFKAKDLLSTWERIGSGSIEFYNFKNSDPELSKCFSETYEKDILRNACNYVYGHKQYFGKTILEVGCESGYMTGFLAKTFPGSRIVAIDACAPAVEITKKRISDLGCSNVEFRNCTLDEVSERFDTVFCMRTLQENFDTDNLPFEGEPLIFLFASYKKRTREYTKLLVDCLKDSGYLCAFERIGHDPLLCGWLLELDNNTCGILPDTYKEMHCKEIDTTNTFQAFVAQKGNQNALRDILDLWRTPLGDYASGSTMLDGWKALDYLYKNAGTLIRGARIFEYKGGPQIGRFALFEDRDDSSLLYYYSAKGSVSNNQLFSYNARLKADLLDELQKVIDINVMEHGFVSEEIDPYEDTLEGRTRIGFLRRY